MAVAAADDELGKKRFLAQANTVCKEAWEAVEAGFAEQLAGLEPGEEPSPASIEAAVDNLVEILRTAATKIEALRGPVTLERRVDTYLDRLNVVVDEFHVDPRSAFEAELTGYPFARPDKLAKRIGLKDCAQRG